MRRNVLEVKDLVRNYRKSVIKESEEDVKVLKGISFQVAEGEFVGIMGKSGCGKTTLLKTLGMIDKPTDGTIKFMGEDTSELYGDKLADIRNSKIGFIFQDFYLMDSLSVEENIMLPMIISKQNINKMIAEAKKYAEQFQIEHLLKKNPYELSGGEKQRVAICRALINNPDLILADEPTGNLDSKSGKIVIDALNKISSEYKKTIVMVTHDPQMASYCNRLILLNDEVTLEALKSSGEQEALYESWEEKILIKQAGIAEGEQIGRSKEKTEFVKKLSNKFSIEQIAEMLEIDISEVENIFKESQNGK